MSKSKKGLTDSQCELRKKVGIEIGMSKEEVQAEVREAIRMYVKTRLEQLDIRGMLTRALNEATGTPKELKATLTSAIERRLQILTNKEVARRFPKNAKLEVSLTLIPQHSIGGEK